MALNFYSTCLVLSGSSYAPLTPAPSLTFQTHQTHPFNWTQRWVKTPATFGNSFTSPGLISIQCTTLSIWRFTHIQPWLQPSRNPPFCRLFLSAASAVPAQPHRAGRLPTSVTAKFCHRPAVRPIPSLLMRAFRGPNTQRLKGKTVN